MPIWRSSLHFRSREHPRRMQICLTLLHPIHSSKSLGKDCSGSYHLGNVCSQACRGFGLRVRRIKVTLISHPSRLELCPVVLPEERVSYHRIIGFLGIELIISLCSCDSPDIMPQDTAVKFAERMVLMMFTDDPVDATRGV